MQDDANIPILTDLIEKGVEIELSELGLDPDTPGDRDEDVAATAPIDTIRGSSAGRNRGEAIAPCS